MVLLETRLMVADNSGITVVKCIGFRRFQLRTVGGAGDVAVFSLVKRKARGQLLKARTCVGLIVGTRKKTVAANGVGVCFPTNAAVLLRTVGRKEVTAVGSRLRGPISCKARQFLTRTALVSQRAVHFF